MDSINVEKIQALRKYKEQQFVSNLLFYPLATLTFGLFCTCPFWFPSLYSSTKALVCVSIPRILSFFFSAKSLFILGNLIVIFLLRESKVRSSDPSYNNNNNNDNLVKPILPKTRSKKAKMHTVSAKKSKIQPSKPLHQNNNDRNPLKLTLPSTEIEKIQMHTAFSQTSKMVVSEGLSERTFIDPYLTSIVDRVRYVEEKGRHRSLAHVEDQAGEEVEEEALWQEEDRTEKRGEAKTRVLREEERDNLKKDIRRDLKVPALPNDDLKKRADDFIAMVTMQIKLEAEEVLLDAC